VVTGTNEEQIAHWAGEGGEHWAAEQDRFDRLLAPFGARVVEALAPSPGDRVLDVGCGNGALTLAVAERVRPGGEAVGVDISTPMLARARQRAAAAGAADATFVEGDAQVVDLGAATFDAAVSRFGVMFFDDPVAAFTNVRRSLREGGRLVFVCWREMLANEWMTVPAFAALEHVPMPSSLGAPGAPGPYAFADPDRVRALLTGAGFRDVSIDQFDAPTWMGSSGEDTLRFLQRTEMARLLVADVPEATAAKAWAAVAAALDERAGPDGVVLSGSAWLVQAR
jgi:SAM-dependent methyltransferase